MENSHLGTATIDKEEGASPQTSNKSSCGLQPVQTFEREYFSPSGIKLEVIELPVKYDTKEWLKHVEQCPEGSRTPWRCTWQTMKNGTPMPCDYSSKKHLVKRHIEATHLCIKYVLTKFGWHFVLMRLRLLQEVSMYMVREDFHATIKCSGLSSEHPVSFFCFPASPIEPGFSALVHPLMGVISAANISRILLRGTSICYEITVIAQERVRRSSSPMTLFEDNLFMSLSSHGR
jgi:hypothetical protein